MKQWIVVCSGLLAAVPFTKADIVWSGDMYLRVYHEVPSIDFNQDGTNDFTYDRVVSGNEDMIWIEPTDGHVIVENDDVSFYPIGMRLFAGVTIDLDLGNPDIRWESEKSALFAHISVFEDDYGGHFAYEDGYLGVSFNVDGLTHYGWVHMSHDPSRLEPYDDSLMIHGWAWETEADTPIVTGAIPEPATGVLTMIGALALWQARRSRHRRKHGLLPNSRLSKPSLRSGTW